jgi:flagellin
MASIATNFSAFNALHNLQRSDEGREQSLIRISGGVGLQRAEQAPADYNTANRLRTEIKALRELRRTELEHVGTLQFADQTLNEVNNTLTRAIELAEASASETFGGDGSAAKLAYDAEYQELLGLLDQLNDDANYNGRTLFGVAGTTYNIPLTVDADGGADQLAVTTTPFSTATLGLTGSHLTTTSNAGTAITTLKTAIESVNRQRAQIGVWGRTLEKNLTAVADQLLNFQDQESQIRDADVASETVALTRYQIQNQSNIAVMAQANLTNEAVFQLLA